VVIAQHKTLEANFPFIRGIVLQQDMFDIMLYIIGQQL